MTKAPRTFGRPARRPTGAARLTAGLLAALGLAVAAAPAHAVELPQLQGPDQAGGAVAPATADSDFGGAVAQVEQAIPVEDGSPPGEAKAPGNAVAPAPDPPAADPGPIEVSQPPPADPQLPVADPQPPPADAQPPPADAQPPPNTAPPQLLDVQAPPGPPAPPPPPVMPVGTPGNLNVDIRILSPGNDGDVVQQNVAPDATRGVPGGEVSGAHDQGPVRDWNWTWNWTCGSDGGASAAIARSGSWNWNWNWDCAAAEVNRLVGDQQRKSPAALPQNFSSQLPAVVTPPADAGPRPETPESGSGGSKVPAAGFVSAQRAEAPAAGVIAPTAKPAARSRAVERPTPAGATDGGPNQLLFSQPLVGSAASTVPPPGGSSSLLLLVLIGALSLLAPRAVEPAWMRARRLRSLIASQRLERPG